MVLLDQGVLHYHLKVKLYLSSYLVNELALGYSMDALYRYKIFPKLFLYELIDEQISHMPDAQFVNQDKILFFSRFFILNSFLRYSIAF